MKFYEGFGDYVPTSLLEEFLDGIYPQLLEKYKFRRADFEAHPFELNKTSLSEQGERYTRALLSKTPHFQKEFFLFFARYENPLDPQKIISTTHNLSKIEAYLLWSTPKFDA